MVRISAPRFTGDSLLTHYKRAINVAYEIRSYDGDDDLVLDLTKSEWFTPASLVPLCVAYNKKVTNGTEIDVDLPSNYLMQEYLSQINFPEGTTDPSQQYSNSLPLCLLNQSPSSGAAENVSQKLRSLLKKEYDSLSPSARQGISLPIYEIVDNIDQHSNCDLGAVLVQNYGSKDFIDIGIVDDGITIPKNFENHSVDFDSDNDAIEMAMEGKVSTKGRGVDRGYGIKTTVNLVCEGLNGSILIASRDGTILQKNSTKVPRDYPVDWPGTIVVCRMSIPEDDFRLNDYITGIGE
ncbi:sensor histidine kinase [Halopiger xanaduensis]|uniref:ATP-binding region ATPase domain protein n=1 Tax=Halopiger xanaduensis (strain DSM 18323 / JCM 14033 / SH-6) TaxID=797210 RepID=F8D613_HALXS|nr:sensor histidine kinase [Halopiger xanaduensis]AEH38873.1 hypothetical protein Halxa_4271 [Halopiger xanaduensis SH-6]